MSLQPAGANADGPAKILYIEPDSPADGVVSVGDEIIKLDETPVAHLWDYINKLDTLKPHAVLVRAKKGEKRSRLGKS